MTRFLESAPDGWALTVEKLKSHPEVSNPFALAHWMAGRGYKPARESGEPYDHEALVRRAKFDAAKNSVKMEGLRDDCHCGGSCKPCSEKMEASSALANAAIMRDGVHAFPNDKCAKCGGEMTEASYFSTCPRDEHGYCAPNDGSSGGSGSGPRQHVLDHMRTEHYNRKLDDDAKLSGAKPDRFATETDAARQARQAYLRVKSAMGANPKSRTLLKDLGIAYEKWRAVRDPKAGWHESERREADTSWFAPLREANPQAAASTPQVVLITAGPGNRMHGNFYPPEIIQRDARIFEGVKCFQNHPGQFDEKNRSEREAEIVLGWFSGVQPVEIDGNTSAVCTLNYMQKLDGSLTEAGERARGYVESAIVYNRQYPEPGKVLLGFSINANGPTHREMTETLVQRYPQFAEALQQREWWNVSDGIESAQSVDLVTFPARGGRVIGLAEAEAYCDAACWQKRMEATA